MISKSVLHGACHTNPTRQRVRLTFRQCRLCRLARQIRSCVHLPRMEDMRASRCKYALAGASGLYCGTVRPAAAHGGKPETRSFRESCLGIAVFPNQSGNFANGRYNRSKRFSYAKANVSLNEHVEPTGLFRPVVISRVILKHRVHSAIHSLAMTFCPSRFRFAD
jgi:hypothetical protein